MTSVPLSYIHGKSVDTIMFYIAHLEGSVPSRSAEEVAARPPGTPPR